MLLMKYNASFEFDSFSGFLSDFTNSSTYATVLCPSVCRLSVTLCIVG